MSYVELHARTAYNFLRGASSPEALAAAAARNNLPAVAALDRNGVYGAPVFYGAAREQGIHPHVGAELVMADATVLPVLVRTRTGYQNLCRLLTRAQLRSKKGEARVDWDELGDFTEGLTALTGDEEGPLRRGWQTNGATGMAAGLAQILRTFGQDETYVEIQRHLVPEEVPVNRALVDLADAQGLPLLATNGVNGATAEAQNVADVFTCLRHHTTLDEAGTLLAPNRERRLKPAAAMHTLFRDRPDAIANTTRLSERLAFTLENLGYRFPAYPTPHGESMEAYLREVTWQGARERYGTGFTPRVKRQIEHELDIITRLGFSGYFLIVWDIVNFCREARVMVQGRGSAANSAVCYSLRLTAVDPVGAKLLFERFLSEGRTSWPDIDLDLPSGDQRERVIQEVYRRYGKHGAAMTANVITYRGRGAMREISKVMALPEEIANRFTTLFPHGDFPHTLPLPEQCRMAGLDPDNTRHRAAVATYAKMLRLPRHLGQHSGGMIVCQDELDTIMPLENASMPGRVVAQWDKDSCEDLGIVKIDLLGLGMMAVLEEAIALTKQRGHPVDLAHIPKDDTATYDLLCRAETIGVFQVESRAQMATLPRMQPRQFYDLVIEVAIIRPGPIAGDLTHPYLNRRQGKEPVTYLDPKLQPILERTLGVPLFQEQVLQIAMILAEFTGTEAEELRRALGFQRSHERMNKVQGKLEAKLRARGHAEEKIALIVKAVTSFALYGFPESHAISFALLAYASAYLKVHYPAEFYTGLLNNQPMGFYSIATLLQEARRFGIKFLPACVAQSALGTSILDDRTIRLGLQAVHGIDREKLGELIATRTAQPFGDLADFRARTRLNRDELRMLAKAGALNGLCGSRRKALWEIEKPATTDELYHDHDESPAPLPEMSLFERIRADFATTSVTVGQHPMGIVRQQLPQELWTAQDLETAPDKTNLEVAGAVICRQRPGTAKGVVFISLEDETGIANCVVYPNLFEAKRLLITQSPYLRIRGRLQRSDGGVLHVMAENIRQLEVPRLPANASHDFH